MSPNPNRRRRSAGGEAYPRIETRRLLLRAFSLDDAADVQRLAGEREVAATTLRIPHPYDDGVAEAWIATHRAELDEGTTLSLAITRNDTGELVGAVSLMQINDEHGHAELGYWIGKPFWQQGLATEAARAVVEFGFAQLGLDKIHAHCLAGNSGSVRVLEKIGMRREGYLHRHVRRWNETHDVELFAASADDEARS